MLKLNLKIALRSAIRQKGFTILSVTGLAVSMASSLLIFLYVDHELNFRPVSFKGRKYSSVAMAFG